MNQTPTAARTPDEWCLEPGRRPQEAEMAIDVLDPHLALERQVTRRLRADESRRLVSAALAEVAVAAIHPASRGPAGHE